MGKRVAPLAYTGIAANLLRGGRTVHSTFGISIHEPNKVGINPNSKAARDLREVSLFVIDEATLISTTLLNTIDITLRDITDTKIPFGGKIMLLGGDFRQCLPIIHGANQSTTVSYCIKSSKLWNRFVKLSLCINIRAKEGGENFRHFLLLVGSGDSGDRIKVPENNVVPSLDVLINRVFGSSLCTRFSDNLATRCVLSTTNKGTMEINNLCLNKFVSSHDSRVYLSVDTVINEGCNRENSDSNSNFDVSFLNTVLTCGLPPHKLELKVGVPIILIRNLNIKRGLCNGTKLIVTRLFKNSIEAKSPNSEFPIVIPRITLVDNDPDLPFTLRRIQLPIRLAFSMTINKSQGQTFDKIGLDLREQCFSHGQLYVGLSRVRCPGDYSVFVGCHNDHNARSDVYIRNVVYREIF